LKDIKKKMWALMVL